MVEVTTHMFLQCAALSAVLTFQGVLGSTVTCCSLLYGHLAHAC